MNIYKKDIYDKDICLCLFYIWEYTHGKQAKM